MAKRKQDTERTDAKGNLHKTFSDGRSEIYIGGFDQENIYIEITDGADEAVNRKRFLPSGTKHGPSVQDTLLTRGEPKAEQKSKSAADSFLRDRTK